MYTFDYFLEILLYDTGINSNKSKKFVEIKCTIKIYENTFKYIFVWLNESATTKIYYDVRYMFSN